MSQLPHRDLNSMAQGRQEEETTSGLTRRTVLGGAAAATAAISVGVVENPAMAQARQEMILFVVLSAALTGITEGKLAPGFRAVPSLSNIDLEKSEPGSDPVDVKQEYFNWVNKRRPTPFRRLLQITKDSLNASDRPQAIIDQVQATPGTKYLARSIVLMWYLGVWHDPNNLQALAEVQNPPATASRFEVISTNAYTQSWALRVARAHPMGFSEMQFGYWTRVPPDLDNFIGKSGA